MNANILINWKLVCTNQFFKNKSDSEYHINDIERKTKYYWK